MPEAIRHIGIDAREIAGSPTGVGRYLAGVLQEWSRTSFPHQITLFLHQEPPAWVHQLLFPCKVVIAPATVAGTWWEQVTLPPLVVGAGVDVLLSPAYTAPLRLRCPSVLIVHDVSFFAQPGGFKWREGLRRRWVTRASATRAAAVVTVSEFSADEITRHLGIPRTQIVIAPQGAPPWRGGPPASARGPMILSVGTVFNRRHLPELLQALAALRLQIPGAQLVVIGGNQTHPRLDITAEARRYGLADGFLWRPYVSDTELDSYYASARAFAFLSDYEGFAMTPMEAASHGVPSVLLDTPVAREVYGDAALLVPCEVPAIATALRTLLTDVDTHETMVARGRARLEHFTWTRTASVLRETLERTQ